MAQLIMLKIKKINEVFNFLAGINNETLNKSIVVCKLQEQ